MRHERKNNNSPLDAELINAFKETFQDEGLFEEAINDARIAFSYVRKDVLWKNEELTNEEQ